METPVTPTIKLITCRRSADIYYKQCHLGMRPHDPRKTKAVPAPHINLAINKKEALSKAHRQVSDIILVIPPLGVRKKIINRFDIWGAGVGSMEFEWTGNLRLR